jgi:hypothetical protein
LGGFPGGSVDRDQAHVGAGDHAHVVAAVQSFPLPDHVSRSALFFSARRLDDEQALQDEQQAAHRIVLVDDDVPGRERQLGADVEQLRDEVLVDC